MAHASESRRLVPPGVRRALLALLAGLLATCSAALLSAFIMTARGLSRGAAFGFSTAAVCLGCFVCANAAARMRKSGGLLCGVCAFAVFALPLLAASCLHGAPAVSVPLFLRWALLLVSGLGGGILGMLRSEKRPRRRG